jgi:hypothetical protein
LSEAAPAGRKCFRCAAPVSDADLASGAAYARDGYFVCPRCLDEIRKGGHGDIETLKSQLAAMTAELRGISQHLHYEEFSWLFVVGGVLQVVVFYLLYRGYQDVEPIPTLLAAVVVQIMGLTAFVVGKLK